MLWLAVLCVLVVGSQADSCCSIEDRREVTAFWKTVWGAQFAHNRVRIAQEVFQDLFKAVPAAKALFTNVNVADLNSPEFKAHCVRVINGLDVVINLLDDPATLIQQLSHLNAQHLARVANGIAIKASYFTEIGRSFAHVLPRAGSCFNPEAWNRCFARVADAISAGLPQ